MKRMAGWIVVRSYPPSHGKKVRAVLYKDNQFARQLRERAYRLAGTGHYDGWREIGSALISEGWPNSRMVMESAFLRLSLDERCAAAREQAVHP